MNFIIAICTLFMLLNISHAGVEGSSSTTLTASEKISAEESKISLEAGLLNSAVNEGSISFSAAFIGDLGRWFSLGVRGNIPISNSLDNQAKLYSIQGLARLNFLNDINNLFLETFVSLNSGRKYNVARGSFGAGVGYLRDLQNNYMVGLNLGGHLTESNTLDGEVSLVLKRLF